MEFCTAMWKDFALKKVKRKFQPNAGQCAPSTDDQDAGPSSINRKSIGKRLPLLLPTPTLTYPFSGLLRTDSLLMHYKAYDEGVIEDDGHDELCDRLKAHMQQIAPDARTHRVAWTVTSSACPIYLLGRYRKLARDVPQSPWTISSQSGGAAEGEGGGDGEVEPLAESGESASEEPPAKKQEVEGEKRIVQLLYKRKGRCSVEEIVTAEVKARLQAADCRMHPCGREDIDVRCLGEPLCCSSLYL